MKVFDEIYETDAWNAGSGLGSLEGVTAEYRDLLQSFLKENEISSVLDLGCGDWQFSRLIDWSGIDYTGVDVVRSVIETNRETYRASNLRFEVGSPDMSGLPDAELLIIKDVLQHLPLDDVRRFVDQVIPRYRYVLVTNCVRPFWRLNADIPAGGFRPVDLRRKPFELEGTRLLSFKGPWHFHRGRPRRWRKFTVLIENAPSA